MKGKILSLWGITRLEIGRKAVCENILIDFFKLKINSIFSIMKICFGSNTLLYGVWLGSACGETQYNQIRVKKKKKGGFGSRKETQSDSRSKRVRVCGGGLTKTYEKNKL